MDLVGVVIGRKTDTEPIQPTLEMLKRLGIDYELFIISAHRKPEEVRKYGLEAEKRGLKVIIAAAGYAAHLFGLSVSRDNKEFMIDAQLLEHVQGRLYRFSIRLATYNYAH